MESKKLMHLTVDQERFTYTTHPTISYFHDEINTQDAQNPEQRKRLNRPVYPASISRKEPRTKRNSSTDDVSDVSVPPSGNSDILRKTSPSADSPIFQLIPTAPSIKVLPNELLKSLDDHKKKITIEYKKNRLPVIHCDPDAGIFLLEELHKNPLWHVYGSLAFCGLPQDVHRKAIATMHPDSLRELFLATPHNQLAHLSKTLFKLIKVELEKKPIDTRTLCRLFHVVPARSLGTLVNMLAHLHPSALSMLLNDPDRVTKETLIQEIAHAVARALALDPHDPDARMLRGHLSPAETIDGIQEMLDSEAAYCKVNERNPPFALAREAASTAMQIAFDCNKPEDFEAALVTTQKFIPFLSTDRDDGKNILTHLAREALFHSPISSKRHIEDKTSLFITILDRAREPQFSKLLSFALPMLFDAKVIASMTEKSRVLKPLEKVLRSSACSQVKPVALQAVAKSLANSLISGDVDAKSLCDVFVGQPISGPCLSLLGAVLAETSATRYDRYSLCEAIILDLCTRPLMKPELLKVIGQASPALINWLGSDSNAENILKKLKPKRTFLSFGDASAQENAIAMLRGALASVRSSSVPVNEAALKKLQDILTKFN